MRATTVVVFKLPEVAGGHD
jgi:isoamylase